MKAQDNIQNSLPANRSWEIVTWVFGIVVLVLMFINTNAYAENLNFEEETYINDIPFSTAQVVANYNYKEAISENIDFEDESFIDDLPFNTGLVSDRIIYSKAIEVEFNMEDEDYIDDIPFDTDSIAKASRNVVYKLQYVSVK